FCDAVHRLRAGSGACAGGLCRGVGRDEEPGGTVFKRILFVCIGNICRSPTAEYLMRARLPADIEVASAGLGALVGHPMDATAARVLLEHGVDGSAHRGQQVTAELLRKSDLILAMEKFQVASIVRTAPEV